MEIQSSKDPLARALGWFSIGLGTSQLAAPRTVAKTIGVKPHRPVRNILYAVGVRELAAGLGILSVRRPAGGLWARAVGDVIDLGLLVLAWQRARAAPRRLFGAFGAVTGALLLDVLGGIRQSRRKARAPKIVAVTVQASPDEIAAVWEEPQRRRSIFFQLKSLTDVELRLAPGGRGTEVRVRVEGIVASNRVRNDLRRLKQVVETGEVVRSDASIHRGMHPARPTSREDLR